MQVPPWQLVEQQSVSRRQEFPSVVQLETAVVTARQVPEVQTPEQHWFAPEQLAPTVRHDPEAHVPPPPQLSPQHCASETHTSFAATQKSSEVHFPNAHTVEQHWEGAVQLSPPGRHASTGGASQ